MPFWNVGARVEYVKQTGKAGDLLAPVLLYGPDSDAWSITLTPTYQKGIFYIRADGAYVHASSTTFGALFDKHDQFRFTGEAGILF